MKERGIIFGGPMVRAILAGMKSQTRRLTKGPFTEDLPYGRPYASVGDRRWVREALREHELAPNAWVYAADEKLIELPRSDPRIPQMISWAHHSESSTCNPIFMPRWASRIDIEVTEVRVQRVQDITEEDARAEGMMSLSEADVAEMARKSRHLGVTRVFSRGPAIARYEVGWDALNGKRAPWASNPSVWAVSFRRVRP